MKTKKLLAFTVPALLAAAFGLCAPAGCGDDAAADADSGADTDTDADADAGLDLDTDTHADSEFGTCRQSCSQAESCIPDTPRATQDADNWSCGAGFCEWLGCLSTAECQEAYPAVEGIVCNDTKAPPSCVPSCAAAADCALEDRPLYDDDNWTCESNFCVFTGCSSDAECQEAYPGTAAVCAEYAETPFCVPSCTVAADCQPEDPVELNDVENWTCTDGACEHRGCLSTEECTGSSHGPDSICVFD